MYEFFQAAFPWILIGLLAAVSSALFRDKEEKR